MKNKKFFAILAISVGITVLIGSFILVGFKLNRGRNDEPRAVDNGPQIEYYTCGMHPSVRVSPEEYDRGKTTCPICNMKLTPVYKEEKQAKAEKGRILFYRHPMNPGITSKAPAKDETDMDYIPVYETAGEDSDYYGCGMEGQEHVFLIEGVKDMACPICGMPLKKLSKQEADNLRGIVSQVKIKGRQIKLAGVRTAPVRKLRLYKEIRTIGKVAYDPQLAIAQEEFISALKALDKIQGGGILEIKERALNLVESSKRKLRLLGLSSKQIEELAEKRQVQTSLILPEKKMWIYGDICFRFGLVKSRPASEGLCIESSGRRIHRRYLFRESGT
jgi:hypothetical protein